MKNTLRQILAHCAGTVTVTEPVKDAPADITTFEVGKDMYGAMMDLPLDERVEYVIAIDDVLNIVMEEK